MKSILVLFVFLGSIFSANTSFAKRKILITSFDAFGGRERNNSALVSEELKRLFESHPDLSQNYSLEFIVLPVQARVAASKARDYLDHMKTSPDLVLSLGESSRLAKKGKSIEINFAGYNRQSQKIYADDRKTVKWDTSAQGRIYPHWDDSVRFNLPIAQMYCALHDEEKKWVSLEDSIGSYVCNDTAFDLALYLRDQSEKQSRARNLAYPYESKKSSELFALAEEEKKTMETMEKELESVVAAEKAILSEIQSDSYLSKELPRLFEYIESEKRSRDGYQDKYKYRSDNRYDAYGRPRSRPGKVAVMNPKTGMWEYREPQSSPSERTRETRDSFNDYKPYPQTRYPETRYPEQGRSDDFAPRGRPLQEEKSEYMLPQRLLDYKSAMEATQRKKSDINYKKQDYKYKANNISNRYDSIIQSINNIADDSLLAGKKPYYGFIHIPILTSGKKTSPLELAQVIAIMIKGTFESRFPHAEIDAKSGRVECGLDSEFVKTEAYQKVYQEYQSLRSRLSISISNFRSSLTKEEMVYGEEELEKLARKSKYKSNYDAQQIPILQQQISVKKAELSKVIAAAPQPHSQRMSYFSGHEKYSGQGEYKKENPASHLLRVSYSTEDKEVNLPFEYDLKIKTDSNQNIVLLLKNEFGKEQTISLSNFETNSISIANLSQRSSMSIRLDNSKSYSKYELRDLRASGVSYTELNSKIDYWMLIEYSYPVLKNRTEYYYVDKFDGKGMKYSTREDRVVQYWDTERTSFSVVLKNSNSHWAFYYQDRPFNALQMTVYKNAEKLDYIQKVNVFDIPVAKPASTVAATDKLN